VSSPATHSWYVGAWRRRSIVVPGGEPTEPCEAWWIQSGDVFVDVRVTLPGCGDSGLPYSSTRAFAGWFEIAGGESRWHVEIDSDGSVPRIDRAAAEGLYISADDSALLIEDAPGRFREEWVQHADTIDVEVVRHSHLIAVRVGDVVGMVHWFGDTVFGRMWDGDRSISTT